jgi:HK97 gp10 family phage protein
MTSPVTFKVEGLRELTAGLDDMSKALQKGVLRRVAVKALEPFDQRWRQLAPDDPTTGAPDLKTSGGIGTKLTRRQARLNRARDDKSYVEIFAGPNNAAAVPQEFGTVNMPAHPFFRIAWADTQNEVLDGVVKGLQPEIEKTAKRAEARSARKAALNGK